MNRAAVLTNARFSGQVIRYHTWPVLRQQTVGEHTWHCMRIYFQIWGPMSPEVSSYLLWHDAGELVTGDLPFPIKSRNPKLAAEIEQLEQQALLTLAGEGARPYLGDGEKLRVKAVDYVETLEMGWCECAQGNKFAQPIVDDISDALKALGKKMIGDDHSKLWTYVLAAKQRCEGCM